VEKISWISPTPGGKRECTNLEGGIRRSRELGRVVVRKGKRKRIVPLGKCPDYERAAPQKGPDVITPALTSQKTLWKGEAEGKNENSRLVNVQRHAAGEARFKRDALNGGKETERS